MADAETTSWRRYTQTVGGLKAWLAEANLPDDTPIVLEGDAGNTYSPLSTIYAGWYTPTFDDFGEAFADDEVVTAEDVANDDALADGVDVGALHLAREADVRCLVLGPLN